MHTLCHSFMGQTFYFIYHVNFRPWCMNREISLSPQQRTALTYWRILAVFFFPFPFWQLVSYMFFYTTNVLRSKGQSLLYFFQMLRHSFPLNSSSIKTIIYKWQSRRVSMEKLHPNSGGGGHLWSLTANNLSLLNSQMWVQWSSRW